MEELSIQESTWHCKTEKRRIWREQGRKGSSLVRESHTQGRPGRSLVMRSAAELPQADGCICQNGVEACHRSN